MIEHLFKSQIGMLKSVDSQLLGIEAVDGKLYIVEGFTKYVTRVDQSLYKAEQYYSPVVADNYIMQQYIDDHGFIPAESKNVVFCKLNNEQIEFDKEFTISVVAPVTIGGKLMGYVLYCNRQEVKRYGI